VAIKVVGLRREHRARLLKRINAKDDHDDQAAADNDDDDDAKPKTTTPTTKPPPLPTTYADNAGDDDDDDDADVIPTFLQQYICRRFNLSPFSLSGIFYAVFVCRRRIPTTVRKVREWYEKSVVRTLQKV